MNLGANITAFRTAQGLSQEQLAQLLGVSRQSVSKWETGTATPDLVHLLRLCEIFSVSLDTLVGQQAAQPAPPVQAASPAPASQQKQGLAAHQTVGIILLCMAFLVMLVCIGMGAQLLEGAVFAVPFALCGIICISVASRPGLWCGWALYAMASLLLPMVSGLTPLAVFNPLLYTGLHHPASIAVSWLMFLAFAALCLYTGKAFSHKPLRLRRRHAVLAALWLVLYLLPIVLVQLQGMELEQQLRIIHFTNITRTVLVTAAGIFAARLFFSKGK